MKSIRISYFLNVPLAFGCLYVWLTLAWYPSWISADHEFARQPKGLLLIALTAAVAFLTVFMVRSFVSAIRRSGLALFSPSKGKTVLTLIYALLSPFQVVYFFPFSFLLIYLFAIPSLWLNTGDKPTFNFGTGTVLLLGLLVMNYAFSCVTANQEDETNGILHAAAYLSLRYVLPLLISGFPVIGHA